MGVVIRCAAGNQQIFKQNYNAFLLAYTGVCPEGTESEITRRSSVKDKNAGHKSLSEYVDEVKSKHLVDVNDYSVSLKNNSTCFIC